MLPFRRALMSAAFLLTIFYLTTRSSSPGIKTPKISTTRPQHEDAPADSSRHETKTDTKAQKQDEAKLQRPDSADRLQPSSDQKVMQYMSKMSLYDKLAYQYPYDIEVKFPAYIWQTWRWTPEQREFQYRLEEASWSEINPGFVHEVIDDKVAVHFLRLLYASTPEILEAFEALPLPVLKADFFRYLILLARGGIYSDIDTLAIKSVVEWIPSGVPQETIGLVIGIEADPDREDWSEWYSRRIQFCQWTIQSKPGHPVLRQIVTKITEETLRRKSSGELKGTNDKEVVEFTGPALWTDVIFAYFNDERYFDMSHSAGPIDWRNFTGMEDRRKVGDVVILPITSFSPGVQQMGAKDVDDPMAFVKHDFDGSWKPEALRRIGKKEKEKAP